MIVWLASYPRSGNTLFRIVLDKIGLGPTYSVHDDKAFSRLELKDVVGHEDLPEGGLEALRQARELYFVKTHGLPVQDGSPAVYIVRDGRDSIASHAHYLRKIENTPSPLPQLIARLIHGKASGFGNWSEHVRLWLRHRQPAPVLVRYEDLAHDPMGTVLSALESLGIEIPGQAEEVKIPGFDELNQASSDFFRKGVSGAWKEDFDKDLERHFWRWNRLGMRLTGYESPADHLPSPASSGLPVLEPDRLIPDMQELKPIEEEICMPPYYGPKDKSDFHILINLAISRSVREVFEFGTARGNTVANLCKYTDARITTLNALPEETSGTFRTYDLDQNQIGSVYRDHGYRDRVQQILEDSMNFIPEEYNPGVTYDMVIIDACHDFEYVLNDFLTIREKVGQNGCVLFHDCDPEMTGHLGGVWTACSHLYHCGFDIHHIKGSWWGYWSPAMQTREIDGDYLELLAGIVELLRTDGLEIDRLNAEVYKYRHIPAHQWVANFFFKRRTRK